MSGNSRAAKIDEERVDTIGWQRRMIMALSGVIISLVIGLIWSFSVRTIWVAPNLNTGQMISKNSPYSAYPYTFTYRALDTLWNWSEDGSKEYPWLIKALGQYMDNEMLAVFQRELTNLSGRKVLEGRTRKIKEIIPKNPNDMVQPLSSDKFVVFVDVEVTDRLNGVIVSILKRRYSFVVYVNTSNIDENPYGLRIARYYQDPINIGN